MPGENRNKISGLSMPQSAGGDAEADKEVIQELNALRQASNVCWRLLS